MQIAAGEVLLHHVLIESGHDDDDKDAAEELFEEVLTGHPVIEYEDAAVFAVADGLYDAVEAYINGYADVEHTLRQLVYHKPNYQICILNQKIVDNYLQFKSYERI